MRIFLCYREKNDVSADTDAVVQRRLNHIIVSPVYICMGSMIRYDFLEAGFEFMRNVRTEPIFTFGQFSVARKI